LSSLGYEISGTTYYINTVLLYNLSDVCRRESQSPTVTGDRQNVSTGKVK